MLHVHAEEEPDLFPLVIGRGPEDLSCRPKYLVSTVARSLHLDPFTHRQKFWELLEERIGECVSAYLLHVGIVNYSSVGYHGPDLSAAFGLIRCESLAEEFRRVDEDRDRPSEHPLLIEDW